MDLHGARLRSAARARPYALVAVMMRATAARASTVSEPLLRLNPPGVGRRPALERGFSVLLVDDNPYHRIPLLRILRDQDDTFGGSHGLDNETQPTSASAREN